MLREYPELKAAYELHVSLDFADENEMMADHEESRSAEAGEEGIRAVRRSGGSGQGTAGKSKLISNELFWQEFLEKNLAFATEPFRGCNPIFIPRVTDAK